LVGDQSMEKFRNEYEKLHRALKKSYESEKRSVKKYVKGQPWSEVCNTNSLFYLMINSNLNF
jgi:hypothetical protein